jgi:hypothetical protein
MAKNSWIAKLLWGLGGTFLVVVALGSAIGKKCVPGDPDYEKGVGFCSGNGRKDQELRKAEANEEAAKEKEKKVREQQAIEAAKKEEALLVRQKANEKTLREIGYICEASIKKGLREPSSYERIESTSYGLPSGEGKKGVVIKYRARNGFGGINIENAACISDSGKTEDLRFVGNADGSS